MKLITYWSGGSEYYIIWSKGNHELRKITNDETGDYKIILTGHYEKVEMGMKQIMTNNIDYDNNL